MLLLDRIVSHTPDGTICTARITERAAVVGADGRVGRWAALEYMAQTVAVHAGLSAWKRNEAVRVGFLIGVRSADFHGSLHIGQVLIGAARHIWGEHNAGAFSCSLRDDVTGAVLAEGQLSVMYAESFAPPRSWTVR
jgi:predicted hotdog family 3-hydroxylacyl-ACP dehydratase